MDSMHAKGFTLVELLTVVAVLAILTAIAFPSFQGSLRSNRVATASNELQASLALARTEAIRSKRGGGICASKKGEDCDGGWNDGWLVWTDSDGDGVKAVGEPVIRYVQAKRKTTLSGTVGIIAFDARGRARSGAQSIGLKPESHDTPVRCIRISATGQTRTEQAACT